MLRGPGHTSAALRGSLASGEAPPDDMRLLVDKVRTRAYEVSDQDVASLRGKYSDDELFEVLVSTSLGAALARLNAGLATLDDAS